MGLASSQARMLLLTARKSDLEYRSQMISQRKINLAMQTESLARDYSQKMSNKKMELVTFHSETSGNQLTEELSYAGLMAENGIAGNFIVTDSLGRIVIGGKDEKEIAENEEKIKKKLGMEDISNIVVKLPYVNNNAMFQDALRNGSLRLLKLDDNTGEYNYVSWSSQDSIRDVYDTSDDDVAQAEYEYKSSLLASQDKQYDLELNQIQTQHKAIETEYDSVKKVIEKNIDVSYKIFG